MSTGDQRRDFVRYHAHLPELGRLVSAAGTIEFHLAGLLGEFISPDNSDVARLVLERVWNFNARQKLLRDLIPLRLIPPHPAVEMHEQLIAWLAAAIDVMKHRNTYLHSMWLGAVEDAHPVAVADGRDHVEVPIQELQILVIEAEDVANHAAVLWEQYAYLTGRFDALIEASRKMGTDWSPDQ